MQRIKTTFGPLYEHGLTKEECIEIEENLAGYLDCLIDIENSLSTKSNLTPFGQKV